MNGNSPDLAFFTELQQTNPDVQFRLPSNVFGIPPSMALETVSIEQMIRICEEAEHEKERAGEFLTQAVTLPSEDWPEWYLENQFHNAQIAENRATYIFHTLNNAVML